MTTPTTPRTPPTVDDIRDLDQEGLRALIVTELAELTTLLPLMEHLADTHQRGIGFLTPAGRLMLDDQIRKERAARLPNLQAGIVITGDVPAPGNLAAYSLAAEVPLLLLDQVQRIRRRAHAAGMCFLRRLPDRPTTKEVIADLEHLVRYLAARPQLMACAITVTDLVTRCRRLVDGNDRTQHPHPCPHCGRHTLVVYLDAGVIRCERDPHTGEYETCLCDDSYCDCKVRHHRHEWHRDKGSQKWGWYGLKNDQARAARAAKNPDQPSEHTQ